MTNNINISPETKKLVDIFSSIKNVEMVPWQTNSNAVGFSLLKDYPNKGLFIPVRNKKGEKDTVAMVRIWYSTEDTNVTNQNRKKLFVAIVKASRYSFSHNFNNFEDEDSPTKESIAVSKASRQPEDLEEEGKYELDLNKDKIYSTKENKEVTPKEVVDEIYKSHLGTITNISLQIKISVKKAIIESIDPINHFLEKVNLHVFDKKIKKSDDFAKGIITPYSYADLDDSSLSPKKAKILGSDFPISYKTATIFVFLFSIIYLINYYYNYDFLKIVQLINSTTNTFFLAVLTIAMLLFFDRIIPYLILFLINTLIKFKWYLIMLKVKI